MDETTPIDEQLRAAITASGKSLNQLARESGVSDPQLSRFMREQRTLRLGAVVKLCKTLRLHLAPIPDAEQDKPATKKGKK